MYFSQSTVVAFSLLASSSLVAGHGAIIKAVGDAGGAGSALGVDPNTPRDGTTRNPFQQDSTRFRGDAKATCGETLGGGDNDITTGTQKIMQLNGATLPQISAGGSLMMTVHQVNSDGAGPYKCMIDSTGTGANWQAITVTQNLPGNAKTGRNQATSKMDQPLTASIPAGQTCTGTVAGQSNICMVRCENPARAGPFGGCIPVQMAGAAGAAAAPAASTSGTTGTTGTTGSTAAAPAANANAGTAGTANTGATANTGSTASTGATSQTAGNSAAAAQNANVASGASTGTSAAAPVSGASARKRAALRLSNDEEEEEIDLE